MEGSVNRGIGKIGMCTEKKRLIFVFQPTFDEFSYLQRIKIVFDGLFIFQCGRYYQLVKSCCVSSHLNVFVLEQSVILDHFHCLE